MQVGFKNGYVDPTSFSMKGINKCHCYQTEWILYGFTTPNEDIAIISENKSAGSTYGNSESSSCCNSDNWATFSVNHIEKAFKYFRMIAKSDSCNSEN